MPLAYRLEDYARYRTQVGAATYLDVTRRTDPARIQEVWAHLREVVDTYGPPWVVQVWTKDPAGALRLGVARALGQMSEEFRKQLRKSGLLTRDSRVVERKKYGQKGARRRFQFSKR